MARQLDEIGYAVLLNMIEPEQTDAIAQQVDRLVAHGPGTRRLLEMPWCGDLANCLKTNAQLRELGTKEAEAVQCTLFTKSADKNWLVAPHQDLSIPVADRVSGVQFSGWSQKEGEIFVQPPVAELKEILAVRLHLDDCDESNGALRVVPGSHRLGRLTAREAVDAGNAMGDVVVAVPRGGAMLLRPLLLHGSSKSVIDGQRRVLHFLFGPRSLPEPLRWPSQKGSISLG